MIKQLFLLSLLLPFFLSPTPALARFTPEDIVNSQKQTYQDKVKSYSVTHQQQLTKLSSQISQLNTQKTEYLEGLMVKQAAILDEYQNRNQGKTTPKIEKARYWITYAHEAVAYQAAKIYIFNLTSEVNIKSDVLNTINLFKGELNSTRSKVLYSQQILSEVIK